MPLSNVSARAIVVISHTSMAETVLADFTNAGTIEANQAALELDIQPTGIAATYQTISNAGLLEEIGGRLTLHGNRSFTTNFATMVNTGTLLAQGGLVDIQADLRQTIGGKVAITQAGTVLLEGAATGGTIQITAGTLAFGLYGRGAPGIPVAAGECTASIQFLGNTGTLDFGTTAVSEVFRAATQDLLVSVPSGGRMVQIADLHLSGRVYTAADFSVHGADVVFSHH